MKKRAPHELDPNRFAVRFWLFIYLSNTAFVLLAVAIVAFRFWRGF
ncbi:hypothetical protein [Brucella sp. IR073]